MPKEHHPAGRSSRRPSARIVRRAGGEMTISPYSGKPESSWLGITQKLVNSHPLKSTELLDAATTAWATLWQTTVGTGSISVKLSDLRVPATIVGYFFEKACAFVRQKSLNS